MQQPTEELASFCRVDPEDRGSTFAQNTTTYLPNCTASHPGSHQSSQPPSKNLKSTTVSIAGWLGFLQSAQIFLQGNQKIQNQTTPEECCSAAGLAFCTDMMCILFNRYQQMTPAMYLRGVVRLQRRRQRKGKGQVQTGPKIISAVDYGSAEYGIWTQGCLHYSHTVVGNTTLYGKVGVDRRVRKANAKGGCLVSSCLYLSRVFCCQF